MLAELASVGTQILGGVLQSQAAKKAAKQQAGGEMAADLKRQSTLKQVTAMQSPGVQAYYGGLNALTGRLGLPTQGVSSAIDGQTAERQPFNPTQYLADHPDVMEAFQKAAPSNLTNNLHIEATPEAYATWFYNTKGQYDPNYQMPAVASPQGSGAAAPQGQPATGAAPTQGAAPAGSTNALTGAPSAGQGYTPPAPYSYTGEDYKASPGFQYQVDQAQKGVLASSAATGALKSGAALKALSDRSQNLAMQDFTAERNFDFNKYTNERNFNRANYDTDTSNLFRYLGAGENALRTTTNAAQGYGDAAAGTEQAYGNINASNSLQQGSIWSGVVGNLGGMGANALGGMAGAGASAGGGIVAPDYTKLAGQTFASNGVQGVGGTASPYKFTF